MSTKELNNKSLVISVAVLIMSCICTNAEDAPHQHLPTRFVNAIFNSPHSPTLEQQIAKFKYASPYQRLAVVRQLLTYIDSKDVILGVDYKPTEGKHNLQLVAGRAVWAIELFLGVELPVVESILSEADSAELTRVATACVKAYENALLDLGTSYDVGSTTAEMVKQYRGKIQPGSRDHARQNVSLTLELFTQWFPLGRKLSELESIIGEKPQKQNGLFEYRFDDGYNATAFILTVSDDGLIINVSIM